MAQTGSSHSVGTAAPDTGRYKHSACSNTAIYNKGNILAPCQNYSCPNKGASWILQEKLT
jgi:hypothetical protein